MGYKSIRRCDLNEIKKIWKFRERLTRKIKDESKLMFAQVEEFQNNTKMEHEGARDYVIYGGKAPDRDGMDSINKLIQKLNKAAILRDVNEHFAAVPTKIQDVHGKIKLIHFLRVVKGKDATEAGQRFDSVYKPKIQHLKKIGRDQRVKQVHRKKLQGIKREAGIG